MQLSVKPRLGMTHVRGGQLLRVSHDHQVSTKGYDKRSDVALGKERAFEAGWVTAAVGDLAIEVFAVKTARVLGYAYLSGPAINIVRYTSDEDRTLLASWFQPTRGIRTASPPPDAALSSFEGWMREVKYVDADVVATTFHCPRGGMPETLRILAGVYSQAPAPAPQRAVTADLIARVQETGSKEFGVLHFQIPGRAQDHACQPFLCDLLLSSPTLQDQSFPILCPETFHSCPQSRALSTFGLVDLTTGTKDPTSAQFTRAEAPKLTELTEAEARRIAKQRYPGCLFALSTTRATQGVSLPPDVSAVLDAVVIAVLHPLDAERCNVVAYVVASANSTSCIPFTPASWPGLRDLLPQDHRRVAKRL